MTPARDGKQNDWIVGALSKLEDGIVVVDRDLRWVYANPAAEKLIGLFPCDEDRGKWAEHAGLYLPDERTVFPSEELPLTRALLGAPSVDVEMFVRNAINPRGTHLLCSASPLLDGEQVHGAVCIFRNNTERRERELATREKERQLIAMLDNIPDMAWLKDREGRFLAVNQLVLEAAVERTTNDVCGLTDFDIYQRPLADRYRTEDAFVMRTGQQHKVTEPFIDANGREHWIETIKRRIVSDTGEVIGTAGISRDVTEQKLAEQELRLSKEQLERRVVEAQESLVRKERLAVLGQLAGGVAHQIRNPLAAIMNASYVLKRHIAPDQHPNVEDAIKIIHDEVRHANVIITGLLDHARVRAPDRHPTSISEITERVLAGDWIPASITIARALNDVPQLLIDADQIHGAIFNLVRNAVEAMPDGGVLRVELAQEEDLVVLTIADTGSGISPAVREHLFEPLHSTKPMGVGLGLVTARTFVEAHGGRIVNVDVPQGARFEIRLPLV